MMGMVTVGDLDSITEELIDRFGPLPWEVQNLLYVIRLKLMAEQAGVKAIAKKGGQLVMRLNEEVGGAREALQSLMPPGVSVGHRQIRIDFSSLSDGWENLLIQIVEKLRDFRQRMMMATEFQEAITP